jgi:hypothetical protein
LEFPTIYITGWLKKFADLKIMLAGKKFSTNKELIAETEAYFEATEKSYYKNGIEWYRQLHNFAFSY